VPIPPHPLPPSGNPDDPGQDWLSDADEALAGLPAEGSAGIDPDEVYAIGPGERSPGWDDDWAEGDGAPLGCTGRGDTTDPLSGLRAAFSCGGPADVMLPGPHLAGLAGEVRQAGPEHLDDDQLTGLLQAAHRLNAWAAELRLSAISQLADRRGTEARASGNWRCVEHVTDEVAVALTLTKWSADRMLSLAVGLDRLSRTRAALACGALDERRAEIIVEELTGLNDKDAAAVEALIIGKAPSQTSAELRRAAHRAVIAADPAAARRRKQKALLDARVEAFTEAAGTAALAGRDLPPAEVLAADRNLTALALDLRKAGAEGTLDQLRARVYLDLLSGQPSGTQAPVSQAQPGDQPSGETQAEPPRSQSRGQPGRPVLRGSVHLTLPLATWLGWSQAPGQVAGFGPLDGDDSRALAAMLAGNPANRWCITLTGPADRPVAHGCARAGPPSSGGASGSGPSPPHRRPPGRAPAGAGPPGSVRWARQVTIKLLETGTCTHGRESPGYQPGRSLRHLIQIRNATCTAPGCRRPATCGDLDHTTPHHLGGRTCECNLGPLCRWHHRCKQTPGWSLVQGSPGTFTWTAPSGRRYHTTPTEYPC
jgi:hypothetical protein